MQLSAASAAAMGSVFAGGRRTFAAAGAPPQPSRHHHHHHRAAAAESQPSQHRPLGPAPRIPGAVASALRPSAYVPIDSSSSSRSSPSGSTGGGSAGAGGGGGGRRAGGGGGVLRAAVGIDLGTTTSAVAVAGLDGRPVVVEDDAGRAVIPSVVFVRQDGTVLVGEDAAAAAEADPANAFYGIKRLMGRTYGEALREIYDARSETSQSASTSSPASTSRLQYEQSLQGASSRGRLRSYSLAEGPGGAVEVACPALGRNMTPQEISAHLLRHLISRARVFLERQQRQQQERQEQQEEEGAPGGGGSGQRSEAEVQVLDAVVTVPAHFGPTQRRAVSEAARAAGLQRVTLLQEPIAAAMAYGFGSPQVPYDVLLVFDLGGGTLDLSVVEAFEGIMEVLSTSGDNYLGGDDFTAAIADWLALQQQQQQQQQQQLQRQQETASAPQSVTAAASSSSSSLSTSAPSTSAPSPPSSPLSTSSHSLALLRAAEAAKLALSEAVAAARTSSSSSSSSSGSGGGGGGGGGSLTGGGAGGVSVRLRLPPATVPIPVPPSGEGGGDCSSSSGGGGGGGGGSGESAFAASRPQPLPAAAADAGEVELSLEAFDQLVRPLLRRLWWPLEEVALATRTQLGGRLPPQLDPRGPDSGSGFESGSGSTSSGSFRGSGSSSGSVWDAEGPGRREGAAAWEFSIFPPSAEGDDGVTTAAAAAAAKYVAPPRRLSGLVLVGAATRLPVVRDYITEVTGLPVRPGVDPETAVALGAALHAGLMVGSVTRGIEMNDGGYVSDQHGRASGFQVAAAATAGTGGGGGAGAHEELYDEPELVWEP